MSLGAIPRSPAGTHFASSGGLTTAEIARAFLLPEPTVAQRLLRAKRKITDAGIPFRVPVRDAFPERLAEVLTVLYRVFARLPADGLAQAARLGGKPFEPMPGRPMKAYTEIPDQIVSSPAKLRAWMLRAFEYTQSLPPKSKATTKRPMRRK